MDKRQAVDLAYLVCAITFIIGLKRLSSPRTAVRGNQVAAFGMVLAIGVTLWDADARNLAWIIAGIVIGGVIGAYSARAVKMTAMPQMVALFNGVGGGAAATGFTLHNNLLIIAGTLVGASGALLTQMMSRAMNRSLANVVFGAFGTGSGTAVVGPAGAQGTVRSASADDVAVMLGYARRVVIVPGYGLAVAQAQHVVRELADQLERKGVDVRYAIHPVAGRMPGHMNVLLAEADVPYTQLYEMDEINAEFPRTDVSLVVGANDVVNPAAKNTPGSPIYGMPVLNVDQSQAVVVLKRSMNTGFAGIDNELFTDPKTTMLFGDAKESLANLVTSVKNV